MREYGEEIMQSKIDEIREMYATPDPHPAEVDDWSNVPMENIEGDARPVYRAVLLRV